MTRKIKKTTMMVSLLMAMIMLFVGVEPSLNAYAAGEETLPIGAYNVGSFTFTDTNLTKPKTMPNGAYKLDFLIRFKKADTDTGIGQVKLRVEVRDMHGNVVRSKTVTDTSGWNGGNYQRDTKFVIGDISVKPGEKYQVFFDASSVNPSQSNGNFRSITISSFVSYVNVDEVVIF